MLSLEEQFCVCFVSGMTFNMNAFSQKAMFLVVVAW
jgi:hypothetical protein